MGGSSGSGNTTSTQTQKWEPPQWTIPGWQALVQGATEMASTPYQAYDGMTVAPMNAYQTGAGNMIEQRAMEGAPDLNVARGAAMNIAGGGASNPYLSDEYTKQIIADNTQQMTDAWKGGGAAQIDALASDGNGWGGGGWQAMQQAGQQALAKNVGQMTSQTLQDQQRFKSGLFAQDRDAQLQAANLSGNLSQDDYKAAQSLMQYGNQLQGYNQGLLGSQYQQWQAGQQYPAQMLDILGTALGKASGVGGSGFSSAVQSNPGLSPISLAGGLGSLGYGLFGK